MKAVRNILFILILINCSNKTFSQMKYFETINFKNLGDEFITKTIVINHNNISIDLNFDSKKPSDNEIETLNTFLSQLENSTQQNEIRIKKDFKSKEENTVREYIII